MEVLLAALGVLASGGLVSLLCSSRALWASRIGMGTALAGGLLGLWPAFAVVLGDPTLRLVAPWEVPYGSLSLVADPLAAFFLIPILGIPALGAVYGHSYLQPEKKPRKIGSFWFFYNLLMASMALVILAHNAVLFLIAWEVMSLASFFLVTFDDDKEDVRRAGWIYLVATHLGTAALFVMFIIMGHGGSLDFVGMGGHHGPEIGVAFVLALVGFGTKAGFVPLHVWLPEAHPAAPSHVSAVMSGVMIKTGIYGLMRVMMILSGTSPPVWWAWALLGIGACSGVVGILFALAQRNLKRLLAYSSVENVGIITLGLGLGNLGLAYGKPTMAVLGFCGALVHLINHGVFKSLLFLGAGVVLHETGTLEIDKLGGLQKRMPWVTLTFGVGAVAICGLPPLNGFVSELLIYVGAYRGSAVMGTELAVPLIFVIMALVAIGGLAVACFTKALGVVFLGEPRSDHVSEHTHEPPWGMRVPMVVLSLICLAIGLGAPWLLQGLHVLMGMITGLSDGQIVAELDGVSEILQRVTWLGATLIVLAALLAVLRRGLLAGRPVESSCTWDCGYAAPTPRMQYTGSSFSQPLTAMSEAILRPRKAKHMAPGLFPESASYATQTPDIFHRFMFAPLFEWTGKGLSRLRWLQHGRVQLYVLYIAVTLLVLLLWRLE